MVDRVDRRGFPKTAESERHGAGLVDVQVFPRNSNMLNTSKAMEFRLMRHCNDSVATSNLQQEEGKFVQQEKVDLQIHSDSGHATPSM